MISNIKYKLQSLLNENLNDSMFLKKMNELVKEQEYSNTEIQEEETDFHKLFDDTLNTLSDSNQQPNLIPTHFKEIDNLIGGLIPGEFVVLGGRPSMGKTQFLVNLALNVSLQHSVLYFTFDLSKEVLVKRFMSCLTHIPISNLMQRTLTEEMQGNLETAKTQIKQHKMYITNKFHDSTDAFRALCKKHIDEFGVKIIFVDYLQLMSSKRHSKYREIELSKISRGLKMIANDFNVCVISSSQLSRTVEVRGGDKRPILSDIRESGAIEQDADKVLFMYRPDYYAIDFDKENRPTKNKVEIIIAKNKNGSLETATLLRDDNFTHFSDVYTVSEVFHFNEVRMNEIFENNFLDDENLSGHPF